MERGDDKVEGHFWFGYTSSVQIVFQNSAVSPKVVLEGLRKQKGNYWLDKVEGHFWLDYTSNVQIVFHISAIRPMVAIQIVIHISAIRSMVAIHQTEDKCAKFEDH